MAKALALGADAIATQQQHLRDRLPVQQAARRLARFLESTVDLMAVLARACGHRRLADLRGRGAAVS